MYEYEYRSEGAGGSIQVGLYSTRFPTRPNYSSAGKASTINWIWKRSSEDDGSFTPGIYRVNPYLIQDGKPQVNYLESWETERLPEYWEKYLGAYSSHLPVYYVTWEGSIACVGGEWWRYYALNGANDAVTPHVVDDYEQLSLQKAYGKLGAADLDLGESLGEYKETIQMLLHPLSSLKKFLLDDRARNWRLLLALAKKDKRQINRLLGRTGLATADTIAATNMELRYGLRPLISLVQDVIDRINTKSEEILDPTKIRSARSRLKFTHEERVEINYDWSYVKTKFRVLVEDEYYSMAAVQYTQSEEQTFLDSLGLTPRHLPEVAWELTGKSFVADWIISIGPWLATLRINPGISVLGNTTGFKHRRKITVETFSMKVNWTALPSPCPWLPVVLPDLDRGENTYVWEQYERKVDVDLSYLPHFTWGRTIDLFKIIDSASMLWQFFRSFK